jgi:hypothetical protein
MRRACGALLAFALVLGSATLAQDVIKLGGKSCGLTGDAKTKAAKELNRLKNQSQGPVGGDIDESITLEKILQPGDDLDRFENRTGARVTGYVVNVKPGGVETCNCHARAVDDIDTHIEIALSKNADKTELMIVEVTPRLRAQVSDHGLDWSTNALRDRYKGKWVTFTGWMMFDTEHINEAENTNPGGSKNWRATCWEIHPITAIKVAAAPAAAPAVAAFAAARSKRVDELKADATTRERLRKRNEGLLLQFGDDDKEELEER